MGFHKKKVPLIEFIISEVQKYPAIWDKGSPKYRDTFKKANAWNTILTNITNAFESKLLSRFDLDSSNGLRTQWKHLKDSYYRQKKDSKPKSGSGSSDVPLKKDYYNQMSFIDTNKGPAQNLSNISLETSDEEETEVDETEVETEVDEAQKLEAECTMKSQNSTPSNNDIDDDGEENSTVPKLGSGPKQSHLGGPTLQGVRRKLDLSAFPIPNPRMYLNVPDPAVTFGSLHSGFEGPQKSVPEKAVQQQRVSEQSRCSSITSPSQTSTTSIVANLDKATSQTLTTTPLRVNSPSDNDKWSFDGTPVKSAGNPPTKKQKTSSRAQDKSDSAPWHDFKIACEAVAKRNTNVKDTDPAGHIGQFVGQSLRNMTPPVQKKCIDGLMSLIYNEPSNIGELEELRTKVQCLEAEKSDLKKQNGVLEEKVKSTSEKSTIQAKEVEELRTKMQCLQAEKSNLLKQIQVLEEKEKFKSRSEISTIQAKLPTTSQISKQATTSQNACASQGMKILKQPCAIPTNSIPGKSWIRLQPPRTPNFQPSTVVGTNKPTFITLPSKTITKPNAASNKCNLID